MSRPVCWQYSPYDNPVTPVIGFGNYDGRLGRGGTCKDVPRSPPCRAKCRVNRCIGCVGLQHYEDCPEWTMCL